MRLRQEHALTGRGEALLGGVFRTWLAMPQNRGRETEARLATAP